jgi:hypothetical protein
MARVLDKLVMGADILLMDGQFEGVYGFTSILTDVHVLEPGVLNEVRFLSLVFRCPVSLRVNAKVL